MQLSDIVRQEVLVELPWLKSNLFDRARSLFVKIIDSEDLVIMAGGPFSARAYDHSAIILCDADGKKLLQVGREVITRRFLKKQRRWPFLTVGTYEREVWMKSSETLESALRRMGPKAGLVRFVVSLDLYDNMIVYKMPRSYKGNIDEWLRGHAAAVVCKAASVLNG